jgi:hypothetical protein
VTLDDLREALPAEWQQVDPPAKICQWRHDPRTVYLQIGDGRVYVSLRSRGGHTGGESWGTRHASDSALLDGAAKAVAHAAVFPTHAGKPIADVPPWAREALLREVERESRANAQDEARVVAEIRRIQDRRAALQAFTLGA